MDAFHNSKSIASNSSSNMYLNKVYINPNFNKASSSAYKSTENVAVYVNQKLPSVAPNVNNLHIINKKIYINPNFIRPTHPTVPVREIPILQKISVNNDITRNINCVINYKDNLNTDNTVTNKSRYSLVRVNKINNGNSTALKNPTNTVRISKYKLVPLNKIKNNTDKFKYPTRSILNNINSSPLGQKQIVGNPLKINISESRHKFIKYKPTVVLDDIMVSREATKKNISISKIKLRRKMLKKNNIPCPSFRKFGKCMRLQIHGHCDFLHDKKHVSMCRKFLKGACYDKDCLLSHDSTLKKMPTCYFFLKGMCTRDECPYLHIKLNEKSKICPQFLNGYCDKGKKCLNLHVNKNSSDVGARSSTSSTHKYIKQFVNNRHKTKVQSNINNDENETQSVDLKGNTTEHRYYQKLGEICEFIKPSRCKLGALPSFIQL